MTIKTLVASTVLSTILLPVTAFTQTYNGQHRRYRNHESARQAQTRSDARHHTKAKVVAGSAVGGAVVGGLLGGGKGAIIGAGVGAGGGLLANKVRKDRDVKQRERGERY